jgi:hypothetical protein
MAAPVPEKEPSKTKFYCGSCSKTFSSSNAHQSHLRSKAHLKLTSQERKDQQRKHSEPSEEQEQINAESKVTEQMNESSGSNPLEAKDKEEVHLEKDTESKPVSLQLTPRHCLFCSKKHRNRETYHSSPPFSFS